MRVTLIQSMRHVHLPSDYTAFELFEDHSLQRVWRATLFETLPWAAASDSYRPSGVCPSLRSALDMRDADRTRFSSLYQIIEGFRAFCTLLAVGLEGSKEDLGKVTVAAKRFNKASYLLTEIGRRV